jgi:hypothetical protein
VIQAITHVDQTQQFLGAPPPRLGSEVAGHGDLHILTGGQRGQQVVQLEHEPDRLGPEAIDVAQLRQVLSVHAHSSAGRKVEGAQDMQQGALPAAAGAHHRHELPGVHRQVHPVQGADLLAIAIHAGQVVRFDHHARRHSPTSMSTKAVIPHLSPSGI